MALRDEADDRAHDLGDPALSVVVLFDLVQNAATCTELHDKVHADIIFEYIL